MFTIRQEILLFINNSSQQQWSEKEMTEADKQLSQTEEPEVALPNGCIGEPLPEDEDQPDNDKKLFLVQIRQGEFSLYIQLGEFTMQLDGQPSIDPYLLLTDRLLDN